MKWYERLKLIREARGLKKSHFAKLVGVSAPTITEWERGETENPSATNTLKICEVLMITPGHLIHGDDLPSGDFQYSGDNEKLGYAFKLLQTVPDAALDQLIAIIETFTKSQK